MKIITLPTGTVWYHGTSANFDPEELGDGEQAWVSDSPITAEYFSGWSGSKLRRRIHSYRLTHEVEIVLIEGQRDWTRMVKELGLLEYMDITEVDHLSVLEALCGPYNGWHIPDNYRGAHSDTVLCDPMSHLEYLETVWL